MNIYTDRFMRVYTKEFEGRKYYTIGLSQKNKEGKWENAYMPLTIPKTEEVENEENIKIKKGFITFYTNKDGKKEYKVVALEIEKEQKEKTTITAEELDKGMELPF